MVKADEMFKLTLVKFNLGLGWDLRRTLWEWEQCINAALWEELRLNTRVMDGSYESQTKQVSNGRNSVCLGKMVWSCWLPRFEQTLSGLLLTLGDPGWMPGTQKKHSLSSLLNWIDKRKYDERLMNREKGRERSQIAMGKSYSA